MGEIKYNGRTYSGLIQANGCFVDTTNLLLATTSFRTSYSYTATEDCFVCLYIVPKENDDVHVDIDGEKVAAWWRGSAIADETARYLRKGQTISVVNAHASYDSFIWVYGLMQGSPITFLSEYASACYDTNEREVGCWIDGKPLYQRTFVYTPSTTISTTTAITTLSSDIEVKDIKGVAVNTQNNRVLPLCYSGNNFGTNFATSASNDLQIEIYGDTWGTNYTFHVTVLYTKSTDTAGSGQLTPTGFETHHYSTNEQIVGTWIDGKPLYERTWELTIPNSSGTYIYNEVVANLDIVTHTEYSIYGIGERGDVPWYPQATILFSEQSAIGIEFYFASTNYAGRKIYYTSRYTKTTN